MLSKRKSQQLKLENQKNSYLTKVSFPGLKINWIITKIIFPDLKKMAKAPRENVKLSHKEFVLNILNTGTMKDLQLLPTIGTKTAYQIYTYR